MWPGNFFYRDNSAVLSSGIVYYRYRKCMPRHLRDLPFDQTRMHEYPVYVVLQDDAVLFYSRAEIFRIPLAGRNTFNDELTETLARVPAMDTAGGDAYYDGRPPDTKAAHTFYSDLSCFPGPIRQHTRPGWIMILFLDFLYDLVHTSVFDKDPCYESVNTRLNANYLFTAIAVKAEYHYCWERWTTSPDYLRPHHLMQLTRAKKKYLSFLTRDHANTLEKFTLWFQGEEKELAGIYDRLPPRPDDDNRELENNRELNTKRLLWLLRRYSFMGILRTNALALLFVIPLLCIDIYRSDLSTLFHTSTFIFLVPPVFMTIYLLICILLGVQHDSMNLGFSLTVPRLLFSILSSWLIIITSKELWLSALNLPWRQALFVCVVITIAVGIFFLQEIRKATGRFNLRRALFILALSFCYCFTIGMVMMRFMGDAMLAESKMPIRWEHTGFASKETILGITIYPPILFFDSFFVLFVSVFIQAFFQEKPLTQSA